MSSKPATQRQPQLLIPRRAFSAWLLAAPFAAAACSRPPATPLAHLHGKEWVHGAYGKYAQSYLDVQTRAEERSNSAYRILAQRGITSLDALQSREVPFFIRVDDQSEHFRIERTVPDRLMFTADMSKQQRDAATADWKLAREHIHTDYDQIRVLNWALTSLLQQLQSIRNTVDNTTQEQYRLTRQLTEVGKGELPFELPYQVSRKDYEHVLYLLLERLDDDSKRLTIMESSIAAVGLTARATDANSGSLAANLDKVLLSVVQDASRTEPRSADYPATQDDDTHLETKGRELYQAILTSPEYDAWLREERNKELQQVGAFLSVIDALTGVPASAVYRQVVDLWTGNGDYLGYLRTAARLLPVGSSLAQAVADAVDKTEKVRRTAATVQAVARGDRPDLPSLGGLVNTGSRFARSRVERQLVFFEDQEEATKARAALAATDIVRGAMPDVPQ